jgi:hypothetical protein
MGADVGWVVRENPPKLRILWLAGQVPSIPLAGDFCATRFMGDLAKGDFHFEHFTKIGMVHASKARR